MTGNKLAAAIRGFAGPVLVPMLTPDEVEYVQAVKRDLVGWAKDQGENETKMKLDTTRTDGVAYIEVDHERT